jgi:hypothetical protein
MPIRRREIGNPVAVSHHPLFDLRLHTFLGFFAVKVPVRDDAGSFAYGDGHHTDNSLYLVSTVL